MNEEVEERSGGGGAAQGGDFCLKFTLAKTNLDRSRKI